MVRKLAKSTRPSSGAGSGIPRRAAQQLLLERRGVCLGMQRKQGTQGLEKRLVSYLLALMQRHAYLSHGDRLSGWLLIPPKKKITLQTKSMTYCTLIASGIRCIPHVPDLGRP